MTFLIEIKVPDVGNVADIDVVEVLVQPGDEIVKEQTLAVLETDKASMDLPSSAAGKVHAVHIKPGDKVSEGTLVVTVEAVDVQPTKAAPPAEVSAAVSTPVAVESAPVAAAVVPGGGDDHR